MIQRLASLKRPALALLVGTLLSLLLLEGLVRGVGWVLSRAQAKPLRTAAASELRVLCLGESTTFLGPPLSVAYPTYLQELLQQALPGVRVAVMNGGIPGGTTPELLARLDGQLRDFAPHVVVAMMGGNDPTGQPLAVQGHWRMNRYLAWSRVYRLMHYLTAFPRVQPAVLAQQAPPEDSPVNPWFLTRPDLQQAFRTLHMVSTLTWKQLCWEHKEVQDALLKAAANHGGRFKEGSLRTFFELAMAALPGEGRLYRLLAMSNRPGMLDPARTRALLEKGCELSPRDASIRVALGQLLEQQGDRTASRKALAQAVGGDYTYVVESMELVTYLVHYLQEERLDTEAQAIFDLLRKVPDQVDLSYTLPLWYWSVRNRSDRVATCQRQFEDYRASKLSQITWQSYHALYEKLNAAGCRLVCAQYAGRSPELLQLMMRDCPGVAFVDNREPFVSYRQAGRYDELFVDMCFGDLGHGTSLGNRYLAENAARVILSLRAY